MRAAAPGDPGRSAFVARNTQVTQVLKTDEIDQLQPPMFIMTVAHFLSGLDKSLFADNPFVKSLAITRVVKPKALRWMVARIVEAEVV